VTFYSRLKIQNKTVFANTGHSVSISIAFPEPMCGMSCEKNEGANENSFLECGLLFPHNRKVFAPAGHERQALASPWKRHVGHAMTPGLLASSRLPMGNSHLHCGASNR